MSEPFGNLAILTRQTNDMQTSWGRQLSHDFRGKKCSLLSASLLLITTDTWHFWFAYPNRLYLTTWGKACLLWGGGLSVMRNVSRVISSQYGQHLFARNASIRRTRKPFFWRNFQKPTQRMDLWNLEFGKDQFLIAKAASSPNLRLKLVIRKCQASWPLK